MFNLKQKFLNAIQYLSQSQLLVLEDQNDHFIINLSSQIKKLQLDALVIYTLQSVALYLKNIKEILGKEIQTQSAFKLDLYNDSVTKEKIIQPIIASPHQRLILNPQFTNQKNLKENQTYINQNELSEIVMDELLLTLLCWEIVQKLNKLGEQDVYEIYIYPNRCNFMILKNNKTPFFTSYKYKMMTILLNSQTQIKGFEKLEMDKEYEINLFDNHPPDHIVSKGVTINLDNESKNGFDQQVIVAPKNYYFIFSTQCESNKNDEIKHIIDFFPSEYPQCRQCKIKIKPLYFDTFYTKLDLFDIWERSQLQLKQYANFVSPDILMKGQLFQMKMDKNTKNIYVSLYQNKENQCKQQDKNLLLTLDSVSTNQETYQVPENILFLYKENQLQQDEINQGVDIDHRWYEINEEQESDEENY